MNSDRPDSRGDRVELVLALYLEQRAAGVPPHLDELCSAHPSLARELRHVVPALDEVLSAGERKTPPLHEAPEGPQATRTVSLASRIAERFGKDADPGVTLDSEARSQASSLRADLMRRLSGEARAEERYSVVREVARGGMGAVYEVWDDELRRSLAMKVALDLASKLRSGGASTDLRNVARFLAEAQVTAQLEHPGIVPVHEVGLSSDGQLYYTMPLVRGRDLRTIFELAEAGSEGWSRTRALGVLLRVSEAMSYAHSRGVIHRDLKPGNVMVGDFGEVYVMDWGLARVDRPGGNATDDGDQTTRPLTTARDDARDDPAVDSLMTHEGETIGTPCYMPPEQARGRVSALGPGADIYALGAMLHHLLAGRPPYTEPGRRMGGAQIVERVIAGPPASLRDLDKPAPVELIAICERAMARDPLDRYADMNALGEDLRAFLEQRVVKAYEAGKRAELKKWMLRNKKLAIASGAAVVILVIGLLVSSILFLRAEKNARDVFRLASIQDYRDLVAKADALWPSTPANVPAFEAWLARARALIDGDAENPGVVQLRQSLDALRTRAHPRTGAMIEAEILSLPEGLDVLRLRGHIAWLGWIADGRKPWSPADVERMRAEVPRILGIEVADLASAPPAQLYKWSRDLAGCDRTCHGYEPIGLELARRAADAAEKEGEGHPSFRFMLAEALVANGLHAEGEALARAVLKDNTSGSSAERAARVCAASNAAKGMDPAACRNEIATLERDLASLMVKLTARTRQWTFDDSRDRWWHDQLISLVADLEWLEEPGTGLIAGVSPEHGWGVRRRLAWAQDIRLRSIDDSDVQAAWRDAIRSIADPTQCPQYAGLQIKAQLGLVPLHRDAHSGLWEFVDLQTGARPALSPGGVVPDSQMGLVFVLLPGGSASIGAQATKPTGLHYDRNAQGNEKPVSSIDLAPFFVSKYEMTQAQWSRITGGAPSFYTKSEDAHPDLHPVEQVSWEDCAVVLGRLGLVLPTEVQWEYAARGGTHESWWTGDDLASVAPAGNFADEKFHDVKQGGERHENWNDGYGVHAPVGCFLPNPFGLFDVYGNVQEWCRDGYGLYNSPVTPREGERRDADTHQRVMRGGSFDATAIEYARSAARTSGEPGTRLQDAGLRPARRLEP